MSQWTEAARRELDDYFRRVRPTLQTGGADPEEVIEDLRRHLDSEVQAARLLIVTDEDVRRLLARIGAPQPTIPEPVLAPKSLLPKAESPQKAGVLLFIAAVLIPAVTFIIEFITGMCADTFFDPMPTFWHVILVGMVPAINACAWTEVYRNNPKHRQILGWANGVAIGIAIFYSLVFVPLMIPGLIGIIFFGFGLLPLAPAFSLLGAVLLRRKLRRLNGESNPGLPGFWRGMALAWLVMLAVETPTIVTRVAMQKAVSPETDTQLTGIRWLRALGREEALLRACYGYTARAQSSDLWSWLIVGKDRVSAGQAREIYDRVTGRAFNSVPAPSVRTGRGDWDGLNDWTWDEDQGGESVGGRIKGLFLASSRLDTTLNPDAAWSYTEWTMEFRNDSRQQREARAQILLPPGGVVSRLTLWVNGEEREAAFAGRSQTREAYQKVAIQQRRDPVLVTTAGPDRVQMQCFPVPPDGGTIKIRLGITAPLTLHNETNGLVRLPVVLERNFTVRKDFKHAIWAQSPTDLETACAALALEPSNDGQVAVRGMMDDGELISPRALLRVRRPAARRFAWAKDTRSSGEQFIRQEIYSPSMTAPSNLVFVVDGSASMTRHWLEIVQVITNSSSNFPITVVVASDCVETLTNGAALAKFRPAGGQDNLPALLQAWNLAVRKPGSAIIWIHGPQPIKLLSEAALTQVIERTPQRPLIYEMQTEFGPDRIVEQLENIRSFQPVLRGGTIAQDVERTVALAQGTAQNWKLRRSVVDTEAAAQADAAVDGTLHLARLWASDTIGRLKSDRKVDEAIKRAALFQLVTPVSGAVVLETKEQFAQNGLQPVDVDSVPSIPEPTVGALLIVSLTTWHLARKRMRRA